MNRRALFGMILGTLAVGPFARAHIVSIAEMFVSTAADCEASMSGVRAVMTPADVQQFGGALSDLALTLGKETAFTSREAAGVIEELIKVGIPVPAYYVCCGSLIIRTEAEAEAFIARLAQVIADAA